MRALSSPAGRDMLHVLNVIWTWLLSDQIVGLVGWVGTFAGLVGLRLTYVEARSARRASTAAQLAVEAFAKRESLADIGLVYSLLSNLDTLVQQTQYIAAQELFKAINWILHDIAHRDGKQSGDQKQVQLLIKNIRTTTVQLKFACLQDPRFKADKLSKTIDGSMQYVLDRKKSLMFEKG